MRALTIALTDVRDVGRSWMLWLSVALFVALTAGVSAVPVLATPDATAGESVGLAVDSSSLLVPIISLLVATQSITGERASGTLRVLLSLPPSRREVVLGKLVGRGAITAVASLAATVATAVVVAVLYGDVPVGTLAVFGGLLALFSVVFVFVGVGISAGVSTTTRSTSAAVAFYLTTGLLWTVVLVGVRYAGTALGVVTPGTTPGWLHVLGALPPNTAFTRTYTALTAGGSAGVPLHRSAPFLLAVLCGWALVVPALGYLRFRTAELD
jgi:ABC-2 type transport system permease protein